MSQQAASTLFHALLTDNAPVELQRRVLRHADATKNHSLLIRLAGIVNLDADVDAALSKRGEADVLMAWANRPGRTTEQLVARFSSEKRATLLAELAARTDLSVEVYTELAKHSSASVATALVVNTSAPLEARRKAAERAITTVRDSYSASYNVRTMFTDLPQEVRDHAVAFAKTPSQIVGLVGIVSSDALETAAERVLELLKADNTGRNVRTALDTVWNALDIPGREKLQERLRSVTAATVFTRAAMQIIDEFITRSLTDPISDAIRALGEETDPNTIRALYKLTSNGSYQERRDALAAAVLNHNTPIDLLTNDIRWIDESMAATLAQRPDFNLESAMMFLDARAGLEMFEEFAKVVNGEELLRHLTASISGLPYWAGATSVIQAKPELALDIYPVSAVFDHTNVAGLARTLVIERLGDDDKRWETFNGLAAEWSGGLTALLDAVDQLV